MVGVFVAKTQGRRARRGHRRRRRAASSARRRSRRRWPSNFAAAALDGIKVPADDLMSDIHASPEYRANLVAVMAKRAVAQANG